jgi:hypothetical protein
MNISRGKGKLISNIKNNDFYKHFLSCLKEIGSNLQLTQKEYIDIISDFNKAISKKIIYEAYEFNMFYRLGTLRIKKYKPKYEVDVNGKLITKKIPVDYKATKELWERDPVAKQNKKLIFHLNKHSDGYKGYFFWSKLKSNVPNKSGYSFKACRTNSRDLGKAFKDPNLKINFYE